MPVGMQTTGAALLYVIGSAGPAFLGTANRPPDYRITRGWVDIFNDLGGTQVPFDLMSVNQQAATIAVLNRFDQRVMDAITSMPNVAGIPGFNAAGDIGTLMVQEGAAFTLVVVYPHFRLKPAMRAIGLKPGIVFPATVLAGPDNVGQGTTEVKRTCIFRHVPVYDPRTGGMLLYHYNVPALPSPT